MRTRAHLVVFEPPQLLMNIEEEKSCFEKYCEPLQTYLRDNNELIYPHQAKALKFVQSKHSEGQLAIVSMATGTGKSGVGVLAAYFLKCHRVLVIAPKQQLAEQLLGDFRGDPKESTEHHPFLMKRGIVDKDGTWRPKSHVVPDTRQLKGTLDKLAMYDVVITNTEKWRENTKAELKDFKPGFFDLVIIDEAHQMPAGTISAVFKHFRDMNVFVLMLTATRFRADKKLLVPGFTQAQIDELCYDFNLKNAMDLGIIRRVRLEPVLAGEDGSGDGDIEHDLFDVVDEVVAQLNAQASTNPGFRPLGLIQVPSKDVCEQMLRQAKAKGYDAMQYTSANKRSRNSQLKAFHDGQKQLLFVVGLLLEGYDQKKISVVGMLKPSKSPVRYSQIIGRAIRKFDKDDKLEAIVVTHAKYEAVARDMHQKYLDGKFGAAVDETPNDMLVD